MRVMRLGKLVFHIGISFMKVRNEDDLQIKWTNDTSGSTEINTFKTVKENNVYRRLFEDVEPKKYGDMFTKGTFLRRT